MKLLKTTKTGLFILFLLLSGLNLRAQDADTTFHLITCGPGIETYSVYGHSALLIVYNKTDSVYNWGVFNFDVPNFAWNFAKGRLSYWLGSEPFSKFLKSYFYEKRYVISQKINLEADEKKLIMDLIHVNLLPENVSYRYDFFYDDCSTRIRDLLEKAIGKDLTYPPEDTDDRPTFREMTGKYQKVYPWLQFGIDLIMGSPGDLEADFRDRMFLPIDMMNGLSAATINRNGRQIPLLQSPVTVLDFPPIIIEQNFFTTPFFVFSILLVIVLFLSLHMKSRAYNNMMDFMLFFIFAILAILMIFFNFFTDHQQMKWNYLIVGFNPFLLMCLVSILLNREGKMWFRIVFYITAAFLLGSLFLPQSFNVAIYPLLLIMLARSSARSRFEWNPMALK